MLILPVNINNQSCPIEAKSFASLLSRQISNSNKAYTSLAEASLVHSRRYVLEERVNEYHRR